MGSHRRLSAMQGQRVQVKGASSFISAEQAELNLKLS